MGAAIQVRPVGPGGMRAPRGRGAQHLHLSMSPCKQPGCLCAQSTLLLICSLLGDLSPRPPTPGRRVHAHDQPQHHHPHQEGAGVQHGGGQPNPGAEGFGQGGRPSLLRAHHAQASGPQYLCCYFRSFLVAMVSCHGACSFMLGRTAAHHTVPFRPAALTLLNLPTTMHGQSLSTERVMVTHILVRVHTHQSPIPRSASRSSRASARWPRTTSCWASLTWSASRRRPAACPRSR